MSNPDSDDSEDKFGLDRIVFFSDAVIAIAITLLVLEIKVPELEAELTGVSLARQTLEMWPEFLGFMVSFWVIAAYWVAHHRIFRFIADYDRRLIYVNLTFLMFIAFMPYATSFLFRYPAHLVTVGVYAGVVAAIGLSLFWLWSYATRKHRLVGQAVTQATIKSISKNLLITPILFLLSIGIAFFSPQWAMYSWIILLPLYLVLRTAE